MAGPQRERLLALSEQLIAEPRTFGFFQAVQLLHRIAPNAPAVGELGPAHLESMRFVHDASLVFHTADIMGIAGRVIRDGRPFVEVTSSILGLVGSKSPLPTYFTEDVVWAEAEEDRSLKAFYDVFHHRLLSLLYRTWKKYRFAIGFRTDGRDIFTKRALGFVGVDAAAAMPSEGLSPQKLLALAHLLALPTRPPRTLSVILSELLPSTGVDVASFIARRVVLRDDQIAKLGTQSSTLGADMTIGKSVLDRSGRFRVTLGPLSSDMFEALLPGGRGYASLRQVVEQFSRGILEPEVELQLNEADTLVFQLGGRRGALLGVTTALPSREKRPTRARFVLSDASRVARSMLVDDQARSQR